VDNAAAQAGPHGCRAAAEAARGGRDVAEEGLGERRRIDGRMDSASFASGLRPRNQRVTRTVRITGPQAQLATRPLPVPLGLHFANQPPIHLPTLT
jgi:hypothetical protein